ncbi:hypothetical protein HPB49_018192 [Dermacentor silvarum]|uniref:Uncharacterized protein n=1 Tax=Dermacentor silvarum TaxID=543639 RepID=A0ACB8CZ10_DERSI|nr:hypothetical protein HPB49_018192 [Dermacentor silvarum]
MRGMGDSSDASGDRRSSSRRRRRSDDDESSLRYILRNQNLFLVVFLFLGVLTVSCACVAIVAAVVEHFWTSIDSDEPMGAAIAAEGAVDNGRKQQGGKSSSAEFLMQRQSEVDGANRAVFCFVNYTAAPGSPHLFVVDNVSADLCDALVFVSVGLDVRQQSARFKRPVEDAEALQSVASLPTPVWVLIGGEPADSRDFRKVVREKRTRLAFVHNAAAWSRRMGVAGVILYWKYPTVRYRSNYSIFVNTMRIVFEHKGLRLSVVVPWETATRRDGLLRPIAIQPARPRRRGHAPYRGPGVVSGHHVPEPDAGRLQGAPQRPDGTVLGARRAVHGHRAHARQDHAERLVRRRHVHPEATWMKNVRVGMRVLGPGKPFAHTNRSGLASYYEVAEALTRRNASSVAQCDSRLLSLLGCPLEGPVGRLRGPRQSAPEAASGAKDCGPRGLGLVHGRLRRGLGTHVASASRGSRRGARLR